MGMTKSVNVNVGVVVNDVIRFKSRVKILNRCNFMNTEATASINSLKRNIIGYIYNVFKFVFNIDIASG